MGCINSKNDLTDINPNIFRVSNIDSEGTVLWSGQLEISRTELTLYRKGKKPTQWPLQCLRRYGYDADLFSFEAGRRCDTGPGIYAFRCRRAENLFHMLQNYIQGRAYSTDENINPSDVFSATQTTNGPTLSSRPPVQSQNSTHSISRPTSVNTVPNNRTSFNNATTTTQSLSPNGTVHSTSNQSRSSDTLTLDANYLEPTPANRPTVSTRCTSGIRLSSVSSGPISPDLASPGSPNSITNILEVTTLNPLPSNNLHHGVSNLYQEFPINNSTQSTSIKKMSLDISPQEPAPLRSNNVLQNKDSMNSLTSIINCANTPTTVINKIGISENVATTTTGSPVTKFQTQPSYNLNLSIQSPNCLSVVNGAENSTHSYMNINLGDFHQTVNNKYSSEDSPHNLTTPTTSKVFGFNNLSYCSTQQANPLTNNALYPTLIDSNRCYENLEPGDIRPLLLKNHRFSKPDIFSKVDLPLNNDKSEPCTPTTTDRKVNYIILDLNDENHKNNININSTSNCMNNNNTHSLNNNTCTTSINNNISTLSSAITSSSTTPNSLLPPESPKNASLGYATIDFNKTIALSNSTNPSSELDSEGSRKTRHSSTIPLSRNSNSISD